MSLDAAERAIQDGDLETAVSSLQAEIRGDSANSKLRVFLFQLLCVMGQWERALTQLKVAADLDAGALPMAQMYRETIGCELVRTEVFAGRKSPMVFGEPAEWLALLIESLLMEGTPGSAAAQELRTRAFEAASVSVGSIDGKAFAWIADADMRIGPVCEAVINGRYYWVPFERLTQVDIEEPADLRDKVWMPARFQFVNGGEAIGVIPTRYPGSERSEDDQIRLARKTVWTEAGQELFAGLGQRVLATDEGDHALMDVRSIRIGVEDSDQPVEATDA